MRRSDRDMLPVLDALRAKEDRISRIQLSVLEEHLTEHQVFERYVLEVAEDEKDEEVFFAARDAAQYLAGKLGESAIIPDMEDSNLDDEEMVYITKKEYKALLERIRRIERRCSIYTEGRQKRFNIDETDADDLVRQSVAARALGCSKSCIRHWGRKGLLKQYLDGRNVYYSKKELLKAKVVRDYIERYNITVSWEK